MPQGIQRRRAKGWKLPEGAVCVDRSTPWGNPFVVGKDGTSERCVELYRYLMTGLICITSKAKYEDQRTVMLYVQGHYQELRGKDLACWCRIGQPCHRDVLLDLANLEPEDLVRKWDEINRIKPVTDRIERSA